VTSEEARGMPAESLMPRPRYGTLQDEDAIETHSWWRIGGRWVFRLRGSVGVRMVGRLESQKKKQQAATVQAGGQPIALTGPETQANVGGFGR
jgi:hypothetical protein